MIKKITIASLITVGSLAVLAAPVQASEDCVANVDLQGSVTRNEATVTNYSKNDACVYDATLAVYDSPKEQDSYQWIEAQKLIGSKTVSVKAGETVTLSVEGKGPSCLNQSDLIRGKDVWEVPTYRDAMDTDVYKVGSCEQSPTATPTPGPTATATPTPAKTVMGLAKTGNIGIMALLLVAGAASLIAGVTLKRFSK